MERGKVWKESGLLTGRKKTARTAQLLSLEQPV